MEKPKSKERRIASQVIGNVGLYYVCYRLSCLGWNVMPTARNAKGIDILIYNFDASCTHSIQVKALSKRAPVPLGIKLESFFAEFVVVCRYVLEEKPECFVELNPRTQVGLFGKKQALAAVELFKPSECQVEKGWEMAVAWLKAHPDLKNDHDERPWLGDGQHPITQREQGSSVQLPIKRKRKCNWCLVSCDAIEQAVAPHGSIACFSNNLVTVDHVKAGTKD